MKIYALDTCCELSGSHVPFGRSTQMKSFVSLHDVKSGSTATFPNFGFGQFSQRVDQLQILVTRATRRNRGTHPPMKKWLAHEQCMPMALPNTRPTCLLRLVNQKQHTCFRSVFRYRVQSLDKSSSLSSFYEIDRHQTEVRQKLGERIPLQGRTI